MRLTPAGKLVLLILIAGLAFGGWRLFGQRKAGGVPGGGGGGGGGGTVVAQKGGGTTGGGGSGGTSGGTKLVLLTSATKKGWLEQQVERFNAANEGKARITVKYVETRAAMQAILNGKEKPALWSPSSPIWAARLRDAWEERNGSSGKPLMDPADPNVYRSYLRTPVVFLTTKDRAARLRPLLGGGQSWNALRDLTTGRRKVVGIAGPLRFAHADPIASNSGFLTIGLVLNAYAQQSGGSGSLEQTAQGVGFAKFLGEVDRNLTNDAAVAGGSSALNKAFVEDPSRYDVIATYESSALEAVRDHPDLAVIYPNPTAVSEQVVATVQGPWLTSDQKQAAAQFLTFLGGEDSIREGINSHFRPQNESGTLTLSPELSRYRANGFQQTFTAVETPPYLAMNEAAGVWRNRVARRASN